MDEQQKIYRVFRLIAMIERGTSLDEIQDELEISDRTFYRYKKTLDSLGFKITQKRGELSLDKSDYFSPLMFTFDELNLFKSLLASLPNNHSLKKSLIDKLVDFTDAELSHKYLRLRLSAMIQEVQQAITDNKRIKILAYQSASGNTVKNRIVEPLRFSEDYVFLHAIDTNDEKTKIFKIDRMGGIEPQSQKRKLTASRDLVSDVFGMSGTEPKPIEIEMNLRSRLLLEEEFPASADFITKSGENFRLKTDVYSYRGIARFVLGLLDETSVTAPQELKDYLNEKVEKRGF